MKKNTIILALTVLILLFSGCNKSNDFYDENSSIIETSEFDTISETDAISSDISLPENIPNSVPEETVSYTKNTKDNSTESTVITKQLSNEKIEFSFGVAKDGKPNVQSVNNQQLFDGYGDVSALALDTKVYNEKKVLYLTFDCGYEYNNNTALILDTLKEKNVKAAFFCTLDYVRKNPELTTRMINEGHIVGNHSSTHPVFPNITRTKMAAELSGMNDFMVSNYNYSTKYFRFPTGAYSHNALELVTSCGYHSVFWSLAYDDWNTDNQRGSEYAYKTVTARLHPGAVILLHAVSVDNGNALGDIIDYAENNGYTFVSLDSYFTDN